MRSKLKVGTNVVFLITEIKAEGLVEMARKVGRWDGPGSRWKAGNGALVLVAPRYLRDVVERIGDRLEKRFREVVVVEAPFGPKVPASGQLGESFAAFVQYGYNVAPGARLVFDGPVDLQPEWYRKFNFQAKLMGEGVLGNFVDGGGGRIPIGPVVFKLPRARMKVMLACSGENWRWRGRHLFRRYEVDKQSGMWPVGPCGEETENQQEHEPNEQGVLGAA
jgi:hypothetical protein